MLEWFTTIPGILVIGGIILLVIAIILFAVGAKKDAKENVIDEQINNDTLPTDNEVNVSQVEQVSEEVSTPVVEPEVTSTIEPVVEPVVESVVNDIPAVEEFATPEVIMIPDEEPVVDVPNVEPVSTEVNEPATVYGGEQPIVDFSVEEKPVTIYGGNDPLEATQKLPQVEENHIPYGGGYSEINIPNVVVEPVVEPVTPIDVVSFNPVSEPEVVNIPDMNIVVPEVEVQPVQPEVEEKPVPVVEEL